MQVPPIDGRHGKLEKALMYPLKIIGYVLAVSAIWVHVSYTPITYGLLISYVLVICVYVGIPFCFKPDKDFSVKDNWQIQRERLIAARGMYAITILFVPTSIFGNWCFGSFVLLSVFLYEVFVFSNKEQKNWEEYADFDIDHSEEIPRPTPSTE
ncbi:MAG: hypothetical protein K9M11_03135 [Candidatus Pacebacteria bacterium]|nr:hypothetical protein [Candidatus Paceibacterota bacterium]